MGSHQEIFIILRQLEVIEKLYCLNKIEQDIYDKWSQDLINKFKKVIRLIPDFNVR